MGTIREIKGVNQDTPGLRKRWFTDDDYWDLYVWTDGNDKITGIQLCYSREDFERSLTWIEGKKFIHTGVSTRRDHKGTKGEQMGSPILVPDGVFDNAGILEKFTEDGKLLEKKIYDFVASKIREYRPDREFDNET
ncbi:MAG: hypothetical protein JW969_17265 [Spirochaetales bacterium]|nr:hypothetical protein [Spirochaetales bacterium]